MANKSILSVLALAGDKAAAVAVAASDLQAAIFHLCHAGQSTPLSDTFESLPNRGKAAKIRAVVSDYWQGAAAYRAATKRDGRLNKSGQYTGLQAANIPFTVADILADLSEAVAVVKKAKAAADSKADESADSKADSKAAADKAAADKTEAEKAAFEESEIGRLSKLVAQYTEDIKRLESANVKLSNDHKAAAKAAAFWEDEAKAAKAKADKLAESLEAMQAAASADKASSRASSRASSKAAASA